MRTLTKLIAPAIAATLAIGAVAPATAAEMHRDSRVEESRHTPSRSVSVRFDLRDLRRDIDRAAARRLISQREAAGLRRDVGEIQRLQAIYSRNGLTRAEANSLQRKVDRVRAALHAERHDRDDHRR